MENQTHNGDALPSHDLFGGFFSQVRCGRDGEWTTLGKIEKTRERAKRHAKAHLESNRAAFGSRCEYRLIINDARRTIDEESKPPHGWRMQWRTTPIISPNTQDQSRRVAVDRIDLLPTVDM
jgi:hypothetical protein